MISDNYILFIILIILIYVFEDSMFALLSISAFAFILIYGDLIILKTLNQVPVNIYLDMITIAYSSLSLYVWFVKASTENNKNKEEY